MRVGIGIRCIIPQMPQILAGYASDRTFHEVHDDLYVKCLSVSGTLCFTHKSGVKLGISVQ